MNKNSKNIKKTPKTQKNSIEKYFGKTINKIYLDRLQQEIEDCSTVSAASNTETQTEKNAGKNEGEQTNEISQQDYIVLKQKNDFLEKKCKELTDKNIKLMNDNRAMKKMLDASKSVNMYKDVKIQRYEAEYAASGKTVNNNSITETSNTMFSGFEKHFSSEQLRELS